MTKPAAAPRKMPRRPKATPAHRIAARASESLSKTDVIAKALALCRREPLQNISIVRVANELDVTPGLIHYHVGGRERLTSGVMNRFYELVVAELPPLDDSWRDDVKNVFEAIYQTYIRFGGVVAYVMSHNRFRLYQLVDEGERDYGAVFFERVIAALRGAGLPAKRTALYAHLLLQHVLSSAYQQTSRQLPEDHQEFLVSRLRTLDPRETPNTHFVLEEFALLGGDEAFSTGLEIVVEAVSRESAPRPGGPRRGGLGPAGVTPGRKLRG